MIKEFFKSDLFKTILKWSIFLLVIIAIALFSAVNLNCITAPDRSDYNSEECFLASDCMYRNQKNLDKTICSDLTKDCVNYNREQRIKARLKYCSENKFNGLTENECRLTLSKD
jgi:hypothetical protein